MKTIRIHDSDNVIIALEAIPAGSTVCDSVAGTFETVTDIPIYHKIASENLAKGTVILKYGCPIGIATQDIAKGAHVHVHNLDSLDAMVEHVGGTK